MKDKNNQDFYGEQVVPKLRELENSQHKAVIFIWSTLWTSENGNEPVRKDIYEGANDKVDKPINKENLKMMLEKYKHQIYKRSNEHSYSPSSPSSVSQTHFHSNVTQNTQPEKDTQELNTKTFKK